LTHGTTPTVTWGRSYYEAFRGHLPAVRPGLVRKNGASIRPGPVLSRFSKAARSDLGRVC